MGNVMPDLVSDLVHELPGGRTLPLASGGWFLAVDVESAGSALIRCQGNLK